MTCTYDSNHAFPFIENNYRQLGLTKREYFAAMVMQGICADPTRNGNFDDYADDAVKQADALIKALEDDRPATT